MSKHEQLQNKFLAELTREKIAVSVFLVNGIKLHGIIACYDEEVLMLKNTITQMVFKHAISTVVPAKIVQISSE